MRRRAGMITRRRNMRLMSIPITTDRRQCRFRLGHVAVVWTLSAVMSCCSGGGGVGATPEAVPVDVAEVVQRDVPVQLHAIGNVEAYATVSVKSLVDGELAEIRFQEGQEVHEGDLLFVIDPRP